MITAIRQMRRAKGMTLQDVAAACNPPTTAQTIGRLETGARTVSVAWLNRIAEALGVTAADLVKLPERADIPVAATLEANGAHAPKYATSLAAPAPRPGMVAVTIAVSIGDHRAGDELWCTMLPPEDFGLALNRDVLVPRPAGRFVFGRLIGREDGKLHLLPLGAGVRQQVLSDPPWIAQATCLIRAL
ncbi:MAG: helix-turn-helix domain-containing protein [Sphingomonas sp.]